MSDTCRHNSSTWLICGGRWEWCWKCGAIREMAQVDKMSCTPLTQFVRPTGIDGENPYPPKPKQNLSPELREEYERRL